MKKLIKTKVINTGLLIFSVALYLFVQVYWSQICSNGGCSFDFMSGILAPVKSLALFLGLIAILFYFVDEIFFKKYLKYFLWWFLLGALVVILQVEPTGTGIMSFTRDGAVQFAGQVAVIVALVFIGIGYFKKKK